MGKRRLWWLLKIATRDLKRKVAVGAKREIAKTTTESAVVSIDKHFELQLVSSTATKYLSPKGQFALAIRRNISNIAAKDAESKWLAR